MWYGGIPIASDGRCAAACDPDGPAGRRCGFWSSNLHGINPNRRWASSCPTASEHFCATRGLFVSCAGPLTPTLAADVGMISLN